MRIKKLEGRLGAVTLPHFWTDCTGIANRGSQSTFLPQIYASQVTHSLASRDQQP